MQDIIETLVTELTRDISEADFTSWKFWIIPIITIILVIVLFLILIKLQWSRSKSSEPDRIISRIYFEWILSLGLVGLSLIVIASPYLQKLWDDFFEGDKSWQLGILLSFLIVMILFIIRIFKYSRLIKNSQLVKVSKLQDLISIPITNKSLKNSIIEIKKTFNKRKWYILIPAIGYILYPFYYYYNKERNIICIVFDNSSSMSGQNAILALDQIFDKLENNNEIIFTTLDGYMPNDMPPVVKTNMEQIMIVQKSSELKAGKVMHFLNPISAKAGLSQIGTSNGSPICESIWKTYLYFKENYSENTYDKNVLIVITDGMDNISESITTGKFFFDDPQFAARFSPNDVFIIDYAQQSSPLTQRFLQAGCIVHSADTSITGYLSSLEDSLQEFHNTSYLIWWMLIIYILAFLSIIIINPSTLK